MEKKLLNVKEAANILNIGRTKTYELIRTKEIPSIRLGKSLRVPQEALEKCLEEKTELPK